MMINIFAIVIIALFILVILLGFKTIFNNGTGLNRYRKGVSIIPPGSFKVVNNSSKTLKATLHKKR